MKPSTVARAVVPVVLAVVTVLLAACSTAVPGVARPEAQSAGREPAIPEAPADWASTALDPCALIAGAPVAATGAPFPTKPHNCVLDHALPGGGTDRLVVRVATAFDTNARARAAAITVGGLTAYQERDTEGDAFDPAECIVHIPISATRAVQVSTGSRGGDLATSCAPGRAAAEAVAAKLASPAAHARPPEATGLGRWHACDLLEKALGYAADPTEGLNAPSADECRATARTVSNADDGAGGGSGRAADARSVEIESEPGPDALGEPAPGDTVVTLPLGPALQRPYQSLCEIRFLSERLPGAPPESAAQHTTVTQRGSGDLCVDAVASATAIQQTLTAPVPPGPPAPPRLGFRTGEADDVMPVACGVFGNTTPDSCRAPRPVEVPPTAQAVLAAPEPTAADISCKILSDAAVAVLGEVALAASGERGCIALSDSGYSVTLDFYPGAAATEYCSRFGLDRADVQVGGRPGIRCAPSNTSFNLTMPATSTSLDAPGVLLVDGTLDNPRGDRTINRPSDEPRVADLTTRITEGVVTRYLSR